MIKDKIKYLTKSLGIDVKRIDTKNERYRIVSLIPGGKIRGHALLAHLVKPFLLSDEELLPVSHTHFLESKLIGKVLLDLGFAVDVIDYRNDTFHPDKEYTFFISPARKYFERYAQILNSDCIKIAHLDTAHWLSNNTNALNRCYEFKTRKGVAIKSYKFIEENKAIELSDYGVVLGNKYTIDTYRYAHKPLFRVPLPTVKTYPKPETKKYDNVKKNFLWFGSNGFIHKGLDIVIEAFTELEDYNLTICGPINSEEDFVKIYYDELYNTRNITTRGWIDVCEKEFLDITDQCIGIVYPSSSESGGGSVLTCMQAGLIPLVTYESSVDVDETYGILIDEISIPGVKEAVLKLSKLSGEKLKEMSDTAWFYSRSNFTHSAYYNGYKNILSKVLNNNT